MPRRPLHLFFVVFFLCGWFLGEARPSAAETSSSPIVILISLDGVRPVDLEHPKLLTLARLRRKGASAKAMTPVFPSNTFPNHVSMVTGVLPEAHGIVSNSFKDPERGKFSYENDPTWLEVEPVWSILARAGVPSASYHWVGSEGVWRNDLGPTHWKPFKSGVSEQKKVDQILTWLDLPEGERPRLITAWFRGVDSAAHRQGPGSQKAVERLERQDQVLASLLAGIAKRKLWPRVTLLIVSDHGMAAVRDSVDLGRHLKEKGVKATLRGAGGFTIIEVGEAQRLRVESVAHELGMKVAWRDGPPVEGATIDNPRFGSGVIVAPVGTVIHRGSISLGKGMKGAHGHWPTAPEMRAVFIAYGRGVPSGGQLGTISNLDVMPTILKLLEVEAPRSLSGRVLFSGETALQEK